MKKSTHSLSRLILFAFALFPILLFPQPIDMDRADAREEFHWGVNAFHQGYFGKALQSFEEGLRLTPDDAQIKTWLARTYFRLGFEDTALSLWKEVMKAGKGTPLLEYIIHVTEMRGGLGKELYSPDLFVVNHELDAGKTGKSLFKRPTSVCALPDGNFYIVAYGSNEVLSLNANALLLSRFLGGVEALNHPFDMVAAGDFFYVSEFEGNVISKFDRNFVKQKSFGGKGVAEGKLLGPQYLAIDPNGYLYVSDWGNRRVSKFDAEGKFILSFGRTSAGYPHPRFEPTGLAASGGRVYVADQFQKIVAVFDDSGNYLEAAGEGALKSPEGLLFYDTDTLLVADGARIMSYSLKREMWKEWCDVSDRAKRLVDLALTPNHDLLAADFDANKVYVISEANSLYSGFFVQVDRVDSSRFPEVVIDLSVEDILGRPIVGLTPQNLFITEGNVPVKKTQVLTRSTAPDPLSVALVVEDSVALDQFDKELALCIENVMGILPTNAKVQIVFAREEAVVEADRSTHEPKKIEELVRRKGRRAWKLDAALKTAVAELAPSSGRKAVIFLTSGVVHDSAFGHYSLQETARALRNNRVRFYPVYLGAPARSSELDFILGETGGKSYLYFDPEGLKTLLDDVTRARTSNYLVRYTSTAEGEFGRRFIPLEVQVLLYKKSGRDESGYYSPLVGK